MENPDVNKVNEQIREEYYFCQTAANDLDRQTLTFKNWSIIFSTASFGWAFTQSEPLYSAIPAVLALLFWYSEGLWKEKHKIYTDRISYLEFVLNNNSGYEVYSGPALSKLHKDHYQGGVKEFFPKRLWYVSVMLPHFIIVILSLFVLSIRLCVA